MVKLLNKQGVIIDISERKKLEREIIESEERYRTLTELSPKSIIIHQDGEIAYANPSAVKTLGATHKDGVIGRPLIDFVHPEFKE
jgi:PAS domain S-box-containing protein